MNQEGELSVLILCISLSLVACTWLMWTIGTPSGKCLLARQLWCLGLADFAGSFGSLCQNLSVLGVDAPHSSWIVGLFLSITGYGTSFYLEPHVAGGFVAVFWRSHLLLKFLDRSLWIAFAQAPLVGAWCTYCLATDRLPWKQIQEVLVVHIAIAFFATCVLYVLAVYRVLWYPRRAAQGVNRMVLLYPLMFVATAGPLWFSYLRGSENTSLPGICLCLHGPCSVLIYTSQAWFSSSLASRENGGSSFAQWAGSCPVGFVVWMPEEVTVPRVQANALRVSEREISYMESEKDPSVPTSSGSPSGSGAGFSELL